MQDAFTEVAKVGGKLALDSAYPYSSGKGKSPGVCHSAGKASVQTKISGYGTSMFTAVCVVFDGIHIQCFEKCTASAV